VEAQFSALGLNVVWGKNAFATDHYLAGTDEQRAQDLNEAFASPNIKAIIATRGGEGSARMLHLLNFSSFPAKIVMGYSDMTAVINSVHQSSGFVTFHGPMGISNWSLASNGQFFKQVVMDGAAVNWTSPASANPYTIRPGVAKGKLIGGNLSILTNILMSKYAPLSAFVGNILFIEDVDEQPYKIDRCEHLCLLLFVLLFFSLQISDSAVAVWRARRGVGGHVRTVHELRCAAAHVFHFGGAESPLGKSADSQLCGGLFWAHWQSVDTAYRSGRCYGRVGSLHFLWTCGAVRVKFCRLGVVWQRRLCQRTHVEAA
jgi:hypothetical protein